MVFTERQPLRLNLSVIVLLSFFNVFLRGHTQEDQPRDSRDRAYWGGCIERDWWRCVYGSVNRARELRLYPLRRSYPASRTKNTDTI